MCAGVVGGDIIATYLQWQTIVDKMHELVVWPTDKPCPLLWQNPKANFLWGLA